MKCHHWFVIIDARPLKYLFALSTSSLNSSHVMSVSRQSRPLKFDLVNYVGPHISKYALTRKYSARRKKEVSGVRLELL